MTFKDYQQDMRQAYLGGATSILVSGIVWIIAGLCAISLSQRASIISFFIGGMFIFPLGVVFAKILGRSGKHQKNNPLAVLSVESTALLFIGLFIAYACYVVQQQHWFFSIMLLIIGMRYLLFQTIYGLKIYWILGSVLTLSGIWCVINHLDFHYAAFIGGTIELLLGIWMLKTQKNNSST